MKAPPSRRAPATAADLALMQGAPPPTGQHVTLANWQEGPYNRWSFQHVGELVPSATVTRGDGPIRPLEAEVDELDTLSLEGVACASTLGAFLEETYTDGFLVLQHGRIRYERYANSLAPATPHLLHSVSKSICGALTGKYVELGIVELDVPVQTYVPELWDSAFGNATVRHLLDMTASVDFNEEYADPKSEVQAQDRATDWRPRRAHDPENSYEFLRSLRGDGKHGRRFQYCSASTDALAWVLERATARRYPDLIAEAVWSRIGAEHDASVTVDSAGFAFANGGISVTLRDLARFGLHMLDGASGAHGDWLMRHVVGGNSALMDGSNFIATYPCGSYSTCWWCTGDDQGTFYGAGIYGQFLWVVPASGLVFVKLSSLPRALDLAVTADHHRAFHSLAASLA